MLVGTGTLRFWTLPLGSENTATNVCIQLEDANGQQTLWNSNCGLAYWDTLAPTISTLQINNGVTWDSDWKLTINAAVSDVVGVDAETGIAISENGGTFMDLPGTVCTYVETTKKYDCVLNTTFNADPTMGSSTYQFRVRDNLGNTYYSSIYMIDFDEGDPMGGLSITQDVDVPNSVKINYSALEVAGLGGTSGIKLITVENVTTNPNNANKEIIYSSGATVLNSVAGERLNYTLTEKTGIVKMTIYDIAGNITEVFSNSVSANRVGLDSSVVSKVINPNKYTLNSPYIPFVIDPEFQAEVLPEAVTGGNIEVTQSFYWDNAVTAVSGFYQFSVTNGDGYVQYVTKEFTLSDLIINGQTATLRMQTIVDKNAPVGIEGNMTYVGLQVEMYVTVTGLAQKVPLYFPAKDASYKIAKVTGSIDDSINIETN